MRADIKTLKQTLDEVVSAETECMLIICSLLAKENEALHNSTLDKIISVFEKWANTPPVEMLKELEEFQQNLP